MKTTCGLDMITKTRVHQGFHWVLEVMHVTNLSIVDRLLGS